jgi:PAS domain S-box-containing protein
MPFKHLVFPSAGSLSVAVVAAFIFILEIWFSTKRAEFRWYRWTAAVSFSTILYAVGILLEYNAPEGPINRFGGLLEWTAVIFLVHALYGFFFSRLNMPSRRYHLAAGGLHVLILILLWSTNIFVSDHFVARRFLILGKPFVEADPGPLGPAFMLYALGASINAIRLWIVKGKERETRSSAYIWGVSFWILLGAHDAACAVGFPSVQYVMEYGFLGFSAALLYTMFSDYLRASDALEQTNGVLRKEMEVRKQAEEELREAALKQRESIKAANVGLWDWDLVTDKVSYSPEWKNQIGYEEREIGNDLEEWRSRVHPDDLEATLERVQHSIEEVQQDHQVEFRFRHKNGSYRWILAQTSVIQDETGRAVRMLGSHVDITERKHAEEELREKSLQAQRLADELELIIDGIPGLVFFKDTENRLVRVNKFMADAQQMTKKQLEGTSCFELYSRETAQAYFEDDLEVIKSCKPKLNIDEMWETEYGTRWLNTNKMPYLNENGEVVGVFGLSLDVTERKKAEQALQESEEKYRSLVESSDDSIYLVDRNSTYLFVNKTHLSRFGVEANEIIGRRYDDFHSKDETEEFKVRVNEVIKTGKSNRYTYKSEKVGGDHLRTLSPVKDSYGNIVAVTVVSKDITELIQAEENLRKTNERLLREQKQRKMLSKRLIDLLEKDRRQIAMELHDHIGQLLASLKMDIELIHNKLKPEHEELGVRITAAQERTTQAIKDVKNISRGLRPGILDALGLIPSLRGLFNEIQRQTDIEIHFFSRNVPKRFAPEKELVIFRIAQEGMSNIVKHAKAKKVFVNLVGKEGELSLSVEDDGIGFDQKKIMKTTAEELPFGLLIMRERAEQIDGDFTLESQPGKGTHVLAEIPI